MSFPCFHTKQPTLWNIILVLSQDSTLRKYISEVRPILGTVACFLAIPVCDLLLQTVGAMGRPSCTWLMEGEENESDRHPRISCYEKCKEEHSLSGASTHTSSSCRWPGSAQDSMSEQGFPEIAKDWTRLLLTVLVRRFKCKYGLVFSS